MKRIEKIELLSDIKSGKKSISDLKFRKCYILDHGNIIEFLTGDEVSINKFLKRFVPGKDTLLKVGYTAYNLPDQYNFCDPSGEILKQIIEKIPELDSEDCRQFIEDARDLRETDFHKTMKGYQP